MPLILVIVINMFAYYSTRILIPDNARRFDLSISLDYIIPLVPFFIVFYILAYAQWIFSYIFHCRESKELCHNIATAGIIAKLLCFACFMILPTQIIRPNIINSDFFRVLTNFIYSIDRPHNLFPSIHCLESWICFRSSLMMKKKNVYYIISQGIFTILVFASTVFVKQHFVVDIVAAIIVAEIGFLLSGKFGFSKIFDKINKNCT